jgi:hydroxymethylglutaryl-CoA reductase (NADPH)
LAFSVPFVETSRFLTHFQELPVSEAATESRYNEDDGSSEDKKWIMKAVKSPGSAGIWNWIGETISEFVDLLKVCALKQRLVP